MVYTEFYFIQGSVPLLYNLYICFIKVYSNCYLFRVFHFIINYYAKIVRIANLIMCVNELFVYFLLIYCHSICIHLFACTNYIYKADLKTLLYIAREINLSSVSVDVNQRIFDFSLRHLNFQLSASTS